MTRLYFTAAIFAICGVALRAQSKKSLRTYGISKMTEKTILISDGQSEEEYVSEYEVYNSDGNWIEKTDLLSNGRVKVNEYRKYENGDLIEEVKDEPLSKKVVEVYPKYSKKLHEYHKQNLSKTSYVNNRDSIIRIKSFSYNRYGDVIEKITSDGEGSLIEKEIYAYDERGFKIEKQSFDKNGELVEKKVYTYE